MRVWRRLATNQLPPILRQWLAAKNPQVLNVAIAGEPRPPFNQLVERFRSPANPPDRLAATGCLCGSNPVLIAGTHAEVDQTLAATGLPPRPTQFRDKGRSGLDGSGDHLPAGGHFRPRCRGDSVQRGLPHYGSQSWLVSSKAARSARASGRPGCRKSRSPEPEERNDWSPFHILDRRFSGRRHWQRKNPNLKSCGRTEKLKSAATRR